MSETRDIRIKVPVLARVEGEGALEFTARGGRVEDMTLRIFEPPRLFEKFLQGREYQEVPDTVARICGICPVAYQMSAVQAIEAAFSVRVDPWIEHMRRVMYCGEWIQSHALHIHMLAAPDFLGYSSVIEMAKDHAEVVRRGLHLQSIGNQLIALFGARSVHPVGVCVGGFHRAPDIKEVAVLRDALQTALPEAEALVQWCATLALPGDDQDFTSVALSHEHDYAMAAGRLVSDRGLDIAIEDYADHFREIQMPQSTAFHALLHDEPYLVGPLARMNLNHQGLPQAVRDTLSTTGIRFPSRNMFHSVVARAVEIHFAIYEALRLLEDYIRPDRPAVPVSAKKGTGHGCTEAPRGILWHRYALDDEGLVKEAVIIPPTSQNQARIEADLRNSLEAYGLEHDDDALRLRSEMVVRNYDPCISCATHFITLKVRRE